MRPAWPLLSSAVLCLALAAPAGAATVDPVSPAAPPTPPAAFSDERLIVEWAAGADRADRVAVRQEADVAFASNLGNRRFQLVEVEPGAAIGDAIRELEADPAVALAERDGYSAPHAIPNDPFFDELWGLLNTGAGIAGFPGAVAGADIDADGAWIRTVGTPATVIAVLDSGYRFEYADLAAVAWVNQAELANGLDDDGNGIADDLNGADFVGADGEDPQSDGDPTDDDLISGGHGVHTAGTAGAAGDDGVGITGVAQNARIMPLRVCSRFADDDESRCPISSQIAAINYAADKGAEVANMSLGGTGFSTALRNAIAAADETLFVISAGNDAEDNDAVPHYPCNYNPLAEGASSVDNVICVAATNQADGLASFSDWGEESVDLGAPGTETLSAYPFFTAFSETFTIDDFSSEWPAGGAHGGFQRTNEAPLFSFGMTDVVGPPAANTVRETTSAPFSLPANGGCRLFQTRRVVLSGTDQYRYSVLLNGTELVASTPAGTAGPGLETRVLALPAAFNASGSVQLRFRFATGAAPAAGAGVWLDDLRLRCADAVGQGSHYAYLQGTSMAAPHVSGAAGLLFSLDPGATVTEVKQALLSSVDPVPALAGKTVTGGRLNVSEAVDLFDTAAPAPPLLTSTDPASPADHNQPRIKGSAEERAIVTLCEGSGCTGPPVSSGTAADLGAEGIGVTVPDNSTTQFSAKATDTAANTSTCSAAIAYGESTPTGPVIVEGPPDEEEAAAGPPPPAIGSPGSGSSQRRCAVPRLVGKTLRRAKAALAAAGCKLGRAIRPRKTGGRGSLVVKSSTPRAGARPLDGIVDLKLGFKKRAATRTR